MDSNDMGMFKKTLTAWGSARTTDGSALIFIFINNLMLLDCNFLLVSRFPDSYSWRILKGKNSLKYAIPVLKSSLAELFNRPRRL